MGTSDGNAGKLWLVAKPRNERRAQLVVEARRAIVRSIVDVSTRDDVEGEGKLVSARDGEVLIPLHATHNVSASGGPAMEHRVRALITRSRTLAASHFGKRVGQRRMPFIAKDVFERATPTGVVGG